MATKKEEYRNPLLQIRVAPELLERLEKVAEMYGVTKGEIARIAIGQYVGQVIGLMDKVAEKASESTAKIDIEKLAEVMVDRLVSKNEL